MDNKKRSPAVTELPNPTYLKFGSSSYSVTSGTLEYSQDRYVPIKNIVSG